MPRARPHANAAGVEFRDVQTVAHAIVDEIAGRSEGRVRGFGMVMHATIAVACERVHRVPITGTQTQAFVRTLGGVRLSLLVSVLASAVSLVIGVAWGTVAGLAGGRTDAWMMRFVDVLYSLPYLFIVIILTTLWQRDSLAVLLLSLGAVGWLTTARIVRAETRTLKRREFIAAARALGVAPPAMLLRHIVPNLLGTVLIYATLTVPQMIVFESFLSFLGLGVQEPRASLGNLILVGAQEMESAPWMLLIPATLLVALLMSLNFLGDGLRDALDPRDH